MSIPHFDETPPTPFTNPDYDVEIEEEEWEDDEEDDE
jgi:hypothetical protein